MRVNIETGEIEPIDFDQFHENLPDEMLNAKRWLLWEERPNPNPEKKPLKVPYYPSGSPRGATDTPTDIESLGTIEEVISAYLNSPAKYSGLGFALGQDETGHFWQGIDFDKISEHKQLGILIDSLPGYVEVSPNGDGVHCIGYGSQFDTIGPSKEDGIEAYASGRYFTVTANAVQHGKLHDLSSFITHHLRPIVAGRAKASTGQEEYHSYDLSRIQVAHVRSALTIFDAEDRPTWINFGICLKKHGNIGRSLWFEWSQQSDKFDPVECAKKWSEFVIDTRHDMDYRHIIKSAQNAGWLNPNSKIEDLEEWSVLDDPISQGFFASGPKAIEYVIDGFIATGITTIAGASGAGKTSVIAPLAALVAGLWSIPSIGVSLRRHVVYVTEDPTQLHRIISGLIAKEPTARPTSEFDQWFHVIAADRRTKDRIKFSINNWRKKYSYTSGDELNNYIIEPLIVLDTTNATIDLDNENDNSEVGKYISIIKQSLGLGSCWLIAHLNKMITKTTDIDELSPRGAGAFVGDSNATAFLIKNKKAENKRFVILGKRRFESKFSALEFDSITHSVKVESHWGEEQEIVYRYGVPRITSLEAIRELDAAASQEEKAKKKEERDTQKEMATSTVCMHIMSYIRQQGGVDVPWRDIKENVGTGAVNLQVAIKQLVEAGKVTCTSSSEYKTAAKFYSLTGR